MGGEFTYPWRGALVGSAELRRQRGPPEAAPGQRGSRARARARAGACVGGGDGEGSGVWGGDIARGLGLQKGLQGVV